MAYISNYSCCDKNIYPRTIFGKDAKVLFEACKKVLQYSLFQEEYAREQESKHQFEENYAKQFRIIYGIAKRHHIRLVWDGENSTCCMPDRWEIYKNGKRIGRINMM